MRAGAPWRRPHRLGAPLCAFAGAAILGVLFALAWTTSAPADIPASGSFLAFFTQQAMRTPHHAFASGLACALGLGVLIGALAALCFNLVASARRR